MGLRQVGRKCLDQIKFVLLCLPYVKGLTATISALFLSGQLLPLIKEYSVDLFQIFYFFIARQQSFEKSQIKLRHIWVNHKDDGIQIV